jgi:hypothetical protein
LVSIYSSINAMLRSILLGLQSGSIWKGTRTLLFNIDSEIIWALSQMHVGCDGNWSLLGVNGGRGWSPISILLGKRLVRPHSHTLIAPLFPLMSKYNMWLLIVLGIHFPWDSINAPSFEISWHMNSWCESSCTETIK